jgi:ABC-type sugar transport system permease subunit
MQLTTDGPLAVLLNRDMCGTNLFRTIFFLPHLTPTGDELDPGLGAG